MVVFVKFCWNDHFFLEKIEERELKTEKANPTYFFRLWCILNVAKAKSFDSCYCSLNRLLKKPFSSIELFGSLPILPVIVKQHLAFSFGRTDGRPRTQGSDFAPFNSCSIQALNGTLDFHLLLGNTLATLISRKLTNANKEKDKLEYWQNETTP